LSVVVNQLSELGYVISTLGPKGGIEFNKSYANHTLYDLVSKIEEFDIVDCFNAETSTCTLSTHCKLQAMIKKATRSFLNELKNYKIKDLK
jgi:Rrf2 family nitric oxide-sensitive transcriptional repressor